MNVQRAILYSTQIIINNKLKLWFDVIYQHNVIYINKYILHTSKLLFLHSGSAQSKTTFCSRLRTVFRLTALLT